MTIDVKELLTPHKELSKDEITAKVKSGEIVVPPKGEERDEFFKLASMSPEDREKEFQPAEPAEEDKGGEGDAPPEKQWYEELGHDSAEKAVEAHTGLADLNNRLQATIDSLNTKEGKRGTQLKDLRAEVEKLRTERDELSKKANPPPTRPERPKRPNPKDFEEGRIDEKYFEAMDQYETKREEYDEAIEYYLSETTNRSIEEVKAALEKQPEPAVDDDREDLSEPWKNFWDTLDGFQKKYDLTTSIPARQISDNLIRMGKGDAAAKQFIATVPKADMDKYAKVEKVALAAYAIDDTNGPRLKYAKFDTVLTDHDFIGEGKLIDTVKQSKLTPEEEQALREEQQRKTDGSVNPPPADKLAQQDRQPGATATREEIKKKYNDLLTEYQIALNSGGHQQKAFEQSEKFTEMAELRVKAGFKPMSGLR